MRFTRLFRTFVGLFMGAYIGTAFFVAAAGLVQLATTRHTDAFRAYGSYVFLLALRVLILMIPVGLVAHIVLYGVHRRTLMAYAAWAAICGGLFGGFGPPGEMAPLKSALLFAAWSVCCAVIAWLIRRPDKDIAHALYPQGQF